ncbi:hypothetical protein Enr13x_28450 [Stieleria neptunia]|uniref:Secreted protein n=1 Tax=Stieleria neptunia TaxID=2527979 RepID=A0A518HQ73_9BACT|nr:hypothetical protein [Stieleria neptunia]QDV42993.1 hypothetical protein Enr13x_28450 [Stieleria neptunia]
MRKCFSWLACSAVLTLPLVGCGDSQPSNVMQNADEQAFADYERMIAEDANVQNEVAPDEEKPE